MKHLFLFSLLLSLISCGGSQEETQFFESKLVLSMDTVVIDSKGEILFLQHNMVLAGLSPDKKFLYNFNPRQHQLEKIDLEEGVLHSLHQFEQEGPNGVGTYIQSVYVLDDEHIFIDAHQHHGLYSISGERLVKFDLAPSTLKGNNLSEGESLFSSIITEPQKLYGIFMDHRTMAMTFGRVDNKDNYFTKIELPEFEDFSSYYISLMNDDGNPLVISGPMFHLLEAGDFFAITNSITNRWYLHDPKKDSVWYKEVDYLEIEARKQGEYRTNFTSQDEYDRETVKFREEINHLYPIWDAKNERFYRFSYKEFAMESAPGEDPNKNYEVYLAVLDKKLEVLHEMAVPEITQPLGFHFVKDGKIWMFENVEDEMAFVILDF